MKKMMAGLAMGLFMFGSVGMASATFIGPSPYLSFNDSPFKGTNFNYFYLEDFEDLTLDTPGVSVDHGIPVNNTNSSAIDSVDGDDGTIDGSGSNGASIFDPTSMMFTFDASILGALPTNAGIVFTDGTPNGLYTFEAFDQNGTSLGAMSATLGDTSFWGTTAEDRFFGATNIVMGSLCCEFSYVASLGYTSLKISKIFFL